MLLQVTKILDVQWFSSNNNNNNNNSDLDLHNYNNTVLQKRQKYDNYSNSCQGTIPTSIYVITFIQHSNKG